MHAHSAHKEVIYVVEGNATASIDGKKTPIGPGCRPILESYLI